MDQIPVLAKLTHIWFRYLYLGLVKVDSCIWPCKVAWKPIQNKAPDLWRFLDAFNFRYTEYIQLLEHYNQVTKTTVSLTC